ncbi:GTPase ObgE [bacterium]|nr:GTPase ObgE [bacterium]
MFIDTAKIKVYGGKGGAGCVSFLRTKTQPRGGPDGGNGGRGGSVLIKADKQLATLSDYFYKPINKAEDGTSGGSTRKNGAYGNDLILKVPVGTIVRDVESGDVLADLNNNEIEITLAKGGRGGFGNLHFKSSTNRAPRESDSGRPGEGRELYLELKIMADAGLVGFPNAGKSTLISAITHAHSKIASYPFTTRQPILGLLEFDNYTTVVIADIPGLIDGAHRNVGLGHKFLRHVERCSLLVFIIDMGGVDNRDPCSDYEILLNELSLHNEELASRQSIVVANKMDLPDSKENLGNFAEKYPELKIIPISALEGIGLEKVTAELQNKLV